jgi:hypothetical protein
VERTGARSLTMSNWISIIESSPSYRLIVRDVWQKGEEFKKENLLFGLLFALCLLNIISNT